jgi:hypothetical protein
LEGCKALVRVVVGVDAALVNPTAAIATTHAMTMPAAQCPTTSHITQIGDVSLTVTEY